MFFRNAFPFIGALCLLGCTALVDGDRTFLAPVKEDAGGAGSQPAYTQIDFLKGKRPSERSVFGLPVTFAGDDLLTAAGGETVTAKDATFEHAGRAYQYRRSGNHYAPDPAFESPRPQADAGDTMNPLASLGFAAPSPSLARADDGVTFAFGISGEDRGTEAHAGAVYLFDRSSGDAGPAVPLEGVEPRAHDCFGFRLAFSGDELVVSAPWADIEAPEGTGTLQDVGAVYLFRRSEGVFHYEGRKTPSFPRENELFGASLALEGSVLVVGAPQDTGGARGVDEDPRVGPSVLSGAVFAYERGEDGVWGDETYIKASDADEYHSFGAAVALSSDTLIVGSPGPLKPGAVYVFHRGSGTWTQDPVPLTLGPQETGFAFGLSVAFADGVLVVGAPNDDSSASGVDGDRLAGGARSSGAAHVYTETPEGFTHVAYLKASHSDAADFFGASVATSHGRIAVAAPAENSGGLDGATIDYTAAGAVYVFAPASAASPGP